MAVRPTLLLFIFISYFSSAQNFESRWNTSLPGESLDNQATIPVNPTYTYDYTVVAFNLVNLLFLRNELCQWKSFRGPDIGRKDHFSGPSLCDYIVESPLSERWER